MAAFGWTACGPIKQPTTFTQTPRESTSTPTVLASNPCGVDPSNKTPESIPETINLPSGRVLEAQSILNIINLPYLLDPSVFEVQKATIMQIFDAAYAKNATVPFSFGLSLTKVACQVNVRYANASQSQQFSGNTRPTNINIDPETGKLTVYIEVLLPPPPNLDGKVTPPDLAETVLKAEYIHVLQYMQLLFELSNLNYTNPDTKQIDLQQLGQDYQQAYNNLSDNFEPLSYALALNNMPPKDIEHLEF